MLLGLAYTIRGTWNRGRADDSQDDYESRETIARVQQALEAAGHELVHLGDGREALARLLADRPDAVFNIAEGYRGPWREATLPAVYELLDLPYTHSDPRALLVSHDKHLAKLAVRSAGLRTPDWSVVDGKSPQDDLPALPAIVKPQYEGTSIGIDSESVVLQAQAAWTKATELCTEYEQAALVESFCPGREFSVAVMGNGDSAYALGALEPVHDSELAVSDWQTKFDTQAKGRFAHWKPGQSADVDECFALALDVHRLLELRDVSRIDLRLDRDGKPNFLEANALPGLDPEHGFVPIIAYGLGWSFDALIDRLMEHARDRWSLPTHE